MQNIIISEKLVVLASKNGVFERKHHEPQAETGQGQEPHILVITSLSIRDSTNVQRAEAAADHGAPQDGHPRRQARKASVTIELQEGGTAANQL